MPTRKPNAEASLRKLGQRLRAGVARQHPAGERSRQTVRQAIQAQHERTQQAQRPASPAAPARQPKPPEPER